MKITLKILIVLASVATQANAACWKQISESDNAAIFIDECSIAKDGIYKKAWVKSVYSSPQSTDDYPSKSYNMTMALFYFNCSSRQNAATQGIYYGADGGVVKSESMSLKQVRFQDSPPGTIGEAEVNFICKSKK